MTLLKKRMPVEIPARIAKELNVKAYQIDAAIALLDEGATVPFIARYRKEVTGGLDDIQLRQMEERLRYLRDMNERRETILDSIAEQGKLSDSLKREIEKADTKARLEDLYLPYKPKRRTKGQIAREAGLEPLALALMNDPRLVPADEATAYVNGESVMDVDAALAGATAILAEHFAEDAGLTGRLRDHLAKFGWLSSTVVRGKEEEGVTYQHYFDHAERLSRVPSHRLLAMLRGQKAGFLKLELLSDRSRILERGEPDRCEATTARHFRVEDKGRPADPLLIKAISIAWREKMMPRLRNELIGRQRERAEAEAIKVFGHNLRDLLLAAPAGPKITLGLDPGLRTGVKCAVVDETGKVITTDTIYPHPPQNAWNEARTTLTQICRQQGVTLIAIGNGTGSRETDKLAGEILPYLAEYDPQKVIVNEAGASIYSASPVAAEELPDLDVTLRGAVSIARRLQDPLAELVKIEPKSIGVGQYQHDVDQNKLSRALDATVEDCVNAVGVDLNTASPALLAHISGLSTALATAVVKFREAEGAFVHREQLLDVPRLGPKTYEQSAGFLRIYDGEEPLDASAVHPEAYEVVDRIAEDLNCDIEDLIGNSDVLRGLRASNYTDDRFGIPTVSDILRELEKPGRDPRPVFKTANLLDEVEEITDLETGMELEGTITNVTNFGAFVDLGIHQDGLIHISELADRFIRDPRDVVHAGQVVRVKVLDVDERRKRISLSMKQVGR